MDEAAADEFCRRVWRRLAASMGLICQDAAVGEEVAQEVLVRVWARWPTGSRLDAPEAWAYRVGVNLCRSRFRRLRAERRAVSRLSRADEYTEDRTDSIAVRAAVAGLPDRQRAALVLRYFADLPVEMTAEVLGCAPGTVKSLTSQAIARLRGELALDDPEEVHRG